MIEALLGVIVGLCIGFNAKSMHTKLDTLIKRDPEPEAKVINPLPPGVADVNSLTGIITPKTPDQLDREERERIRGL